MPIHTDDVVYTECDAAFAALMRLRAAVLLGRVEDARQSWAELEDAMRALQGLLLDVFPARPED